MYVYICTYKITLEKRDYSFVLFIPISCVYINSLCRAVVAWNLQIGFSREQHLPMKNQHGSTVILRTDDALQPGDADNLDVFSGK